MPETILNPISTVSNQWVIVGGSGTVYGNLFDSDDSSTIEEANLNRTSIVTVSDFREDGSSIRRVRFYIRGVLVNTRSGNSDIQVIIENSSGTALWAEDITINFTSGYAPENHYGTWRTVSSVAGNSWSISDLQGARLNMNTSPESPPGSSRVQINKANIEVSWTESDSVFFGANF